MKEIDSVPFQYPGDDEPDDKVCMAKLETIRMLLPLIIDSDNPRLDCECLSILCGLGVARGQTETEIAKRYGLGRSAISKRINNLSRVLEIKPSGALLTEDERAKYRLSNKFRTP
jgi:hypothetical protein